MTWRRVAAVLAAVGLAIAVAGQYGHPLTIRIAGRPIPVVDLPLNPPSVGLPWITGW